MQFRDRIKSFQRVPAARLRPNPRNWRKHPPAQKNLLRALLAEIGYADALLARELPDGSLELIDGHLRAEITPDAEIPVLVVDLDQSEADKLLALHDPLAGMAETDHKMFTDLLARVETEQDEVQNFLDRMMAEQNSVLDLDSSPMMPDRDANPDRTARNQEPAPKDIAIPELFQVVVECRNELEQQTVFERLTAEGYSCKLLML